jgi:hypothetical protein
MKSLSELSKSELESLITNSNLNGKSININDPIFDCATCGEKGASYYYICDMCQEVDTISNRPKCRAELFSALGETNLLKTCEAYLDECENKEIDSDTEHFIFEEVMGFIYGKDIWSYVNGLK